MENRYCEFCKLYHGKLHADFFYSTLYSNFVVIFDKNTSGHRSVTNDAEYVLWEINRNYKEIVNCYVIYKDSNNIYDEIIINYKVRFVEFKSLNEMDVVKAVNKCFAFHHKKPKNHHYI